MIYIHIKTSRTVAKPRAVEGTLKLSFGRTKPSAARVLAVGRSVAAIRKRAAYTYVVAIFNIYIFNIHVDNMQGNIQSNVYVGVLVTYISNKYWLHVY